MRKIIQSINVTPDGFCDHRNAIPDEELHKNASELLRNADLMLFGRVVYQMFEDYWPHARKDKTAPEYMFEFADLVNNIPKIVYSKTLKTADWQNSTLVHEINKEDILKLKQMPGKDILIAGPTIFDQLAKMGVIDEYYFQVHPMIGGHGKRFFETIKLDTAIPLEFIDAKIFKSGVINLRYKAKTI